MTHKNSKMKDKYSVASHEDNKTEIDSYEFLKT
jgi:hypothetical protein